MTVKGTIEKIKRIKEYEKPIMWFLLMFVSVGMVIQLFWTPRKIIYSETPSYQDSSMVVNNYRIFIINKNDSIIEYDFEKTINYIDTADDSTHIWYLTEFLKREKLRNKE
jgi:hypothetical protein